MNDSPPIPPMPRRFRATYERSRITLGLTSASPALLYFLAAIVLGSQNPELAFALFGVATLAWWVGRPFGVGAAVGFVVGMVPFFAARLAPLFGHSCGVHGCSTWCMPACASAGMVAGLVGSRWLIRLDADHRAWCIASMITFGAGAMGCSCLGAGSLSALAGTWLLSSLPALPKLRAAYS